MIKTLIDNIPLDYSSCVSNEIVPENWCLDENEVPRYVGMENWPPRTIKHYTHAGYEKCFSGKTIVLLGDSRVRYQFMHLAWYLNSQKRLKCEDYHAIDNSIRPDPQCIVINEKLRNDWNSWYNITTDMLDSNRSNSSVVLDELPTQLSLCDCYRDPSNYPGYENRFVKRFTPSGEINLIYLNNCLGAVVMNEEYPPFVNFYEAPKHSDDNQIHELKGDVNETMWNILPKLGTTHAFVSLGWESLTSFDVVSEFSCSIREFERHHPGIKVYLITHPPARQNIGNPSTVFDMKKLKCDSDVLDRTIMNKNVPYSWYWDSVHVLSILNEEYNHRLVEKICPIP